MFKLIKKIKNKFVKKSNYYMKYCEQPIQKNKILLEAGQGKNLNGNMFAILKELCTNKKWEHIEPVFVVTADTEASAKERLTFYRLSAKTVIRNTKEYCYDLATAKYLLTDNSFPPYFNKREGQIYMNTWHGTPLKLMGKSDIQNAMSLANIQKNYLMADYALFPNTFTRDVFMKDYMLENIYTGKIFLCDYPRNSVFMDEKFSSDLKNKLQLQNKQLIAYLPTWRGTNRKADAAVQKRIMHEYFLEIDKRLGEHQIFYVNLHFLLGNVMDYSEYKHIKPFPPEYETYEFLAICDMLITDYSSVFFDFASTGRKIILFPYDLDEYMRDRGTYFPITVLPFPIAYNVESLIDEINQADASEDYADFLNEYCRYRDLHAPEKVLEAVINGNEKNVVIEKAPDNGKELEIIYVGALNNKVQNRKILDYVISLDRKKKNILLCFRGAIRPAVIETLIKLPENVNYMALVSQVDMGILQRVMAICSMRSTVAASWLDRRLEPVFEKERKRIFYSLVPTKVVYYAGKPNYLYKILSGFSCVREAYIHHPVFEGYDVLNKQYQIMRNFFDDHYNRVYDESSMDIGRYCNEEEKKEYYNTCFQISNLLPFFRNKKNSVGVWSLALVRTTLPCELNEIKIRLSAEQYYDAHMAKGIKIGKGYRLTRYALEIPFENMKTLDVQNKVTFVFEDSCGYGMERGIRYSLLNFCRGKGKEGAIKIFPEENTSAYFRQSKYNYMYFTVRSCNLTDSKKAQIQMTLAYYAAKVIPKNNILVLYEKNSSRYEESASVLYEKLIDQGYSNAYFFIDKRYAYLDTIPEKYRANLVYKGTFRHYFYFFKAKTFLGSEMLSHAIDLRIKNKYANRRLVSNDINYVFLQHGVMYMVSLDAETRSFFKTSNTKGIYRVVTSSRKEAEHFVKLGQYDPSYLYICGLPKYDRNSWNSGADKIVIMLTWRAWEYNAVRFNFENSKYYQMIMRIFQAIPEEYHEKVIILPHPLFFDAVKEAEFDLKKYFDGNTKYDEILRNTKVLITDYSSIAYDAFYRGANVIFYWEEKEECLKNYGPSAKLMLNEKNVYGDVCYRKEDLEKVIVRNYLEGQTPQHRENYHQIVEFHDGKNTERLIDMLKRDKII